MSTDSGLLGRLGTACYRHRWLTVLAWIAGLACLVTLWMRFGAAAQNSFTSNDPGQWAGQLAEMVLQMRAVIGRHRGGNADQGPERPGPDLSSEVTRYGLTAQASLS